MLCTFEVQDSFSGTTETFVFYGDQLDMLDKLLWSLPAIGGVVGDEATTRNETLKQLSQTCDKCGAQWYPVYPQGKDVQSHSPQYTVHMRILALSRWGCSVTVRIRPPMFPRHCSNLGGNIQWSMTRSTVVLDAESHSLNRVTAPHPSRCHEHLRTYVCRSPFLALLAIPMKWVSLYHQYLFRWHNYD